MMVETRLDFEHIPPGASGKPIILVEPHPFQHRGWRFWICTHCYAPRSLHPRLNWVKARPEGSNYYLSDDAPHFKEGW